MITLRKLKPSSLCIRIRAEYTLRGELPPGNANTQKRPAFCLLSYFVGNVVGAFLCRFVDVGWDFFQSGQYRPFKCILRPIIPGGDSVESDLRTKIGFHNLIGINKLIKACRF